MIERPPHLQTLQEESSNDAKLKALIDSINNRYLYWSDVKYRAPHAMSAVELWSKVKSVRRQTALTVWPHCHLHFSLTNAMQRLCYELDMKLGGSWGSVQLVPSDKSAQELYLTSSFMEEAIASSQMEGAATTREVAKDMLRKKLSPKDKSQRMIVNNYQTINFIRDHVKSKLTPALVMELHRMMTANALDVDDAAGRFRRADENIVVGDGITGETVHTPPPPECLPAFVQQLCDFFNDEQTDVFIHPIIRAIIVHYLVGYYHPFADGNGRTARALFYWYMFKSDYWLVQYLSISRIIKGSKKAYENAFLHSEADGNDMGYFVQYNLDVLHKSFEAFRVYLKRKNKEKQESERILRLGNISPRQSQIIRMYLDAPQQVLQSTDVMAKFGITANTAKSDLKKLTAQGFLKEISINGRTKGYIQSENFTTLLRDVE